MGVLERWRSDAWAHEVDQWIRDRIRSVGAVVTGSVRVAHVRFWSVVLEVPTSGGTLWFKECAPGQGFEPALLAQLAELEPAHFPRPLAMDVDDRRMLLPDLGVDRQGRGIGDWAATMSELARLQQRLADQHGALAAAGLPSMMPADAPPYVESLTMRLAALPASHAQHLTEGEAHGILSRLGLVAEWSDRLAASSIPPSFQHNDVSPSNTFGEVGAPSCWIDVGDAFWSHPFAVLQVPTAMLTDTWPWGPDWDDGGARAIADAYLAPWNGHADVGRLRGLLESARRLAILQRCESWRRLIDTGGELPDDPTLPILRDHLVAATGERGARSRSRST